MSEFSQMPDGPKPSLREKYAFRNLSRNQRIVVLAVVAGLILVAGAMLKPEQRGPAPPSPSDLARLQRQGQRRSLEGITEYFQFVANGIRKHLVKVDGPEAPGVVWDAKGVLLAADRAWRNWRPGTVQAGSTSVNAEDIRPSPEFSLAVIDVRSVPGLAPVQWQNGEAPSPGAWVEFVSWSSSDQPVFLYGAFLRERRAVCEDVPYREVVTSIPLDASMEGGGLFDMDGNFLAFIASCGDRRTAIAAASLPAIVTRAGSFEGRLAWLHGLKVLALGDQEKTALRTDSGVVVSGVRKGFSAEMAGLLPGDIIQAIDGAKVESPDALMPLTLPPARLMFDLRVRRANRTLTLRLPAGTTAKTEANRGAAIYGATVVPPPSGLELEGARSGSLAYDIGLRTGDRVVRVEQMEASSVEAVRRYISGLSRLPRYLVVERGDWRLLLLPPAGMEQRAQ